MAMLCVFDLDHTLVRSPLDLRAVRAEIRALATGYGIALPEASLRWTIAETIGHLAAHDAGLEAACWTRVVAHETAALEGAACEPGAREAVETLAGAGVPLAVWTNNARGAAEVALARCGLREFFVTVITRDEAALKPDPAGLALLRAAHPDRAIWVVGDSWVDGAAAQAGGAAFIAYGTDPEELRRRAIVPRAIVHDLRRVPGCLGLRGGLGRPPRHPPVGGADEAGARSGTPAVRGWEPTWAPGDPDSLPNGSGPDGAGRYDEPG
jgi:phosphoglycolate phosphatase